MIIPPFLLERHFAKYEFEVPYQLSCSDCEPLGLAGLLAMAPPEAVRHWENLKLSYTESAGHPLLRSEIACWYGNLEPQDILVCVPEEGIFLVMNALLKPGDRITCQSPAYQSLFEVAKSAGVVVDFWEAGPDGEYHPEHLIEALTPETRMVVVNFPHNPTGSMIDREPFEGIATLCRERGILLFSDEMYRGLEAEPDRMLPVAASLYEGAVSLCGMSKSFALPGLRIGWLACRNPEIRDRLVRIKDYTTICSSAPSEILAIIALQNRDRILDRNRAIIRNNIGLVESLVSGHADVLWWRPPKAGSVALLDLGPGLDPEAVCHELLVKKETLAIGSHLFGSDRPAIRLGLGRLGFGEALGRLEEWVQEGEGNAKPQ